MTRRPNILFILADDMGCGDLGCFGGTDASTPCLDAMSREGVRFTQHYAGSPVCAPSRAAFLTGRYPHRTGAIDTPEGRGLDRLSLRETTLANVLKSAGYATGLIGKWHLGALHPSYHPNARGFDEFTGFRGGWSDYWQWRLERNGSISTADGRYLTDVFTTEALDFVRRHRDEPFFLHLAYNAPHFPLQVPDDEAAPFRETGRFTDSVSMIYGMNRRMDRGVGDLLNLLAELGIENNTLVIFTSDNGPEFGGKADRCTTRFNCDLNGRKCLTYEGGIRVPAIVRWPTELPSDVVRSELTHFTDWFPTLAGIAGADFDNALRLDGRDALPALRGEPMEQGGPRFWQWNRYSPIGTCNAAMRDGDWKLVRPVIPEAMFLTRADIEMDRMLKYEPEKVNDISRDPEPERHIPDPPAPLLFDMAADPCERNDLAGARPEIVSRMTSALDDWFEEVDSERRALEPI